MAATEKQKKAMLYIKQMNALEKLKKKYAQKTLDEKMEQGKLFNGEEEK